MPDHREFKNSLYAQFARIGHALSSPKRVELLDLLAQGEKTVEALAEYTALPIKNASAHLRVMRHAGLVDTRKMGTYVYYRLVDDDVLNVVRAVETLSHRRLAEVQRIVQLYLDANDELEPVTFRELRRLMKTREVTVVDVRPADEFNAGHIPGALSIPATDLKRRIRELPRNREVIAYCRGKYCVYSLDAVTMLRRRGFHARRAAEGMPDWRTRGLPVELGS